MAGIIAIITRDGIVVIDAAKGASTLVDRFGASVTTGEAVAVVIKEVNTGALAAQKVDDLNDASELHRDLQAEDLNGFVRDGFASVLGLIAGIGAAWAGPAASLAADFAISSAYQSVYNYFGYLSRTYIDLVALHETLNKFTLEIHDWPAKQFIDAGYNGSLMDLERFGTNPYVNLDDVISEARDKFRTASTIVSPIALDLDGSGLATVGMDAGVSFDHDANRFVERTGWIDGQDGLLALDRDANGVIDSGRELFGSETLLAGGGKAQHGYQALAELDGNADGQINAQDGAYANIRIWKDADGDGRSSPEELLTLAAAGVQSIATASTATDQVDAHGNVVKQTGTFTRSDGSTGQGADIWFAVNRTLTTALDWLPETPEIAALPDLKGYGNVHSLHQTMLRDGSGRLQSLMQQFAAAVDVPARRALLDQILYAWTGVENIAPESRGFMPDARQLHALEAFLGENFIQGYGYNAGTPNAGWNAGEYLTGIYLELADGIYGQLMAQTHLKPLFDTISITWDVVNNQLQWDVSGTASVLEGLSTAGRSDAIRDFIGALSQRGESGAQIFEALRAQGTVAGDFTNWVMTFGGGGGTIASTSTVGDAGNNTLVGTAASDLLLGKQGDDVLDGGAGNDLLQGDQGNDTYLFGLGSGQDALLDLEGTAMQNALVGAYLNDMASSFREQAAAVTA